MYTIIKMYKTREVGQPLNFSNLSHAINCGEKWSSVINNGLQNRNYKIIINL